MDQVSTPFYTDLKFWSLIISILALLLSQSKFFINLLRRARLSVEAYSQIYIFHRIGNPNAQLHLIISNTGGRKIRIKGIKLKISSTAGDNFVIPANAYHQKQSDSQTVLFTPFSLLPGEEWAHVIHFFNYLSRQDDKLIRESTSALHEDLKAKIAKRGKDEQHVTVYGEDDLVLPIRNLFNRHFKWQPEEYDLTLAIDTEPPDAFANQHFRFVLFESDVAEMRKVVERYCMGLGICFPLDITEGVFLPIQKRS